MTLKELKTMIAEEFTAYQNEAEDEVDVSVSDNDIDTEMGDEMAPEGEEDVLRSIFDLLKTHFEGGEDDMDMDMGDEEMPMDDMGGEEEELDENSSTEASTQKTGMKPFAKSSAGPNVGYGAVGGKGSTGYDASSKALQERFQKLANIIK
tara:strand:+ start:120 stop:569 length:450 start_codon:yes stop_codon:yes gene_type:complete